MQNQWGHWYLYIDTIEPECRLEETTDALLAQCDMLAAEGITVDVLQAAAWRTLATLVLREEGEAGLTEFLKELAQNV